MSMASEVMKLLYYYTITENLHDINDNAAPSRNGRLLFFLLYLLFTNTVA